MARGATDDLAVIISASTEQLGNDLARAARMFKDFAKSTENATSTGGGGFFGGMLKSAREAGIGAGREFHRAASSVKSALATPFRAMIQGGNAAALTNPIIAATAAVDAFAAVAETPFKLMAGAAHLAAGIVPLPFKLLGAAAGLGSLKVGNLIGTVGDLAGAVASGLGGAFSALGEIVGQVFSGIGRGAIQLSAVVFPHLRDSVNLAADLEQTTIAFETLIGDAKQAQGLMAGMRQYAAESPFSGKDVTGATRMLIGYGTAVENALPLVKMLGDVAAGATKPLGDVAYLYGTAMNKAHLDAVDVKQFNQFMPFSREMAKALKVPQDALEGLVEQGKIGRKEMDRAFKSMTSSGGLFFQMVDRQKDSFNAVWEQMSDAVDRAKTRLGMALIDGLGLKGAMRDTESFANAVNEAIGRIEPFVKWLGEAGRAAATVGKDLAAVAADMTGLARALEGATGVKIDRIAMTRAFYEFADDALAKLQLVAAGVGGLIDYARAEGAGFANDFKTYFVDPVMDLVKSLNAAVQSLRELRDTGRGVAMAARVQWDSMFGEQTPMDRLAVLSMSKNYDKLGAMVGDKSTDGGAALRALWPAISDASARADTLFAPPKPGDPADRTLSHARLLHTSIALANELNNRGYTKIRPDLERLSAAQGKFYAPFGDDLLALNHKMVAEGQVPAFRPAPVTPRTDPLFAATDKAKSIFGEMRDRIRASKDLTLADLAAKQSAQDFREAIGGVAGAAVLAKDALSALGSGDAYKGQYAPDALVMSVGKSARERFGKDEPTKLIEEFRALQMSAYLGYFHPGTPGGIDFGTANRAQTDWMSRSQELTGSYRLTDSAEVGTVESVRLLNAIATQGMRNTPEQQLNVLVQMRALMEKQLGISERASDRAPVVAPMPRG